MSYSNNKTVVYHNGRWEKAQNASTDLYSQTLHYGCGVFEGMRAYNTEFGPQVFKMREHYERLKYSADKMHMTFDFELEELEDLTMQLLDKNQLKNAYIRPLVYVDAYMHLTPAQKSKLFLAAWEWPNLFMDKKLKVATSSYRRPDPRSCHVDAKVCGHYTNSLLASTEARVKGYDEALLMDVHGFVAEGPGANFFFEKDGVLYTSEKGNILPGITRQTVLELADELGFTVKEMAFMPEDVYGADAAFFTGTAAEVTPLESLDGHNFKQEWEETLSYVLQRRYKLLVTHKNEAALALL